MERERPCLFPWTRCNDYLCAADQQVWTPITAPWLALNLCRQIQERHLTVLISVNSINLVGSMRQSSQPAAFRSTVFFFRFCGRWATRERLDWTFRLCCWVVEQLPCFTCRIVKEELSVFDRCCTLLIDRDVLCWPVETDVLNILPNSVLTAWTHYWLNIADIIRVPCCVLLPRSIILSTCHRYDNMPFWYEHVVICVTVFESQSLLLKLRVLAHMSLNVCVMWCRDTSWCIM